jgi:parallel beta-helix repeat protein
VACVALFFTLVGCIDSSPLAPAVSESERAARVVATPASASLVVDSGITLSAVVENSRGEQLSSPVLWFSSDTLVAVVSRDGHVTALREGRATIRAKAGDVEGATEVATTAVVDSVRVLPANPVLRIGRKTQLTAQAFDANGRKLNRAVKWESSDTTVATISSTGMMTALAPGSATIYASADLVSPELATYDSALEQNIAGKSGKVKKGRTKATVTQAPVSSVTMSPTSSSIGIGGTVQFSATLRDADGNTVTGSSITWSSSNTAIATVSASGLVRGVAFGSADVVATVNGVQSSAVVDVVPTEPLSLALDQSALDLTAGQSARVGATLKDATGHTVTGVTFAWSSSNTSVAKVATSSTSTSAIISALAPGSASITASASGARATLALDVSAVPVASVAVSPSSLQLEVGGTATLGAKALDANGGSLTGRSISWSSSNTGVAKVSSGGVVTAVAAGSANISATIDGKQGSAAVTVTAPAPTPTEPTPTEPTPTDPPPSSTSPVGPSASLNPTAGVVVRAGESIQAAVNANPAGTTFWLKAGVYHGQTVAPKDGMTFVGEVGAILDGDNTAKQAFFSTADNVTIRNLVIQNYNPPLQDGAIRGDWNASTGWVIEYNEVKNNRGGAGIYISNQSTIRNNYIHHNGQLGILGRGNGAVVTGNEISYNNTGGNDPNWAAGGVKLLYSTGLRFANNYVHDNMGQGVWFDINNIDCIIDGNRVENNTHAGIFYEISYGAIIRNNTVISNGGTGSIARSGILISASPNVEVYGNTLSGNSNGIVGLQANRSDAPDIGRGPHVVSDMWVHDNDVSMSRGYTGLVDQVGDGGIFTRNNRFDRNTYYVSSLSSPFYGKGGAMSSSKWRAAGFDVNGIFK